MYQADKKFNIGIGKKKSSAPCGPQDSPTPSYFSAGHYIE